MITLGSKIYLKIDDYKKLLHEERLTLASGTKLVLKPRQDPRTKEDFMELGFELSPDDMPSQGLMIAWINAFYAQDEALVMDIKQRIEQQLQGKKVLEQQQNEENKVC